MLTGIYVLRNLRGTIPPGTLSWMRFEHGWPFCYLVRDAWIDPDGHGRVRAGSWQIWRGIYEFDSVALLLNLAVLVFLNVAMISAIGYWRRRGARKRELLES